MIRFPLLALGLFLTIPVVAGQGLGSIGSEIIYPKDLHVKEWTRLYEQIEKVRRLQRQYVERYAGDRLISEKAAEVGLGKSEYLRVHVFNRIPPITIKEVDDYIADNRHRYDKRALDDMQQLKARVSVGLLEVKKDEAIAALYKELFAENKVEIRQLFADVESPRITVPITEKDFVLGPSDARVTMVKFMDLECPFCKKMFPIVLDVQEEFGKDVRLVIKHFPLSVKKGAFQWAVATECAGKQGAFLAYADSVYRYGKDAGPSDLAGKLELDLSEFNECIDTDETVTKKVEADRALAIESGISVTPVVLVNGVPLIGLKTHDELATRIRAELSD